MKQRQFNSFPAVGTVHIPTPHRTIEEPVSPQQDGETQDVFMVPMFLPPPFLRRS